MYHIRGLASLSFGTRVRYVHQTEWTVDYRGEKLLGT